MELKQGYKQTEVGVIPEDWDALSIIEVAKITTGGSDTQDKINDGEFPFFVRSQNVERINQYTMDCEAILTSGDGVGVGKIFHYVNAKFDFHQRVYCLYDFNQKTTGKYLFYQFSTSFYNRVMQLTAKSSVDSVRREMIAEMKLPFPKKISEQKAIANALSDMDALISQTEKLIEKKKAIKQGAMQELLKPKDGWVTKKLGDVCEIKKGQLITDSTRINGSIPVIAGGKSPAYYHNKANRLGKTITISGSGASAGYVAFHTQPIFASDCSTISEAKNYKLEFIFYWLQLNQFRIYKMQTGGAQPHIHPSDLNPLEFNLPPIEQQNEISDALYCADLEISFLELKLNKLKQQKQGMMQALLTGKIRLVS
jgi:type I restriction enzyme S subunit